jgi:hypothetical protein
MVKDLVVLRIDAFEKDTLTGQRYLIVPALNAFSLGRAVLAKGERIGTLTPLRELLNDDGDVTILAQPENVALLPAVQALIEALQAARLRVKDYRPRSGETACLSDNCPTLRPGQWLLMLPA